MLTKLIISKIKTKREKTLKVLWTMKIIDKYCKQLNVNRFDNFTL